MASVPQPPPPVDAADAATGGRPQGPSPAEEHPTRTPQRSSLNGGELPRPQTANNASKPKNAGSFSRMVNELGRRLYIRTAREDLVNKNIIKDEDRASPTYTAAKKALHKEREKDKLSHKLKRRPSAIDMEQRNILRSASNAQNEASLTGVNGEEKPLETQQAIFEVRKTQLKSILKHRPERSELEHQNILKTPECADTGGPPSTDNTVRQEKQQPESQSDELVVGERWKAQETPRGINFNNTVSIIPTFRSVEYNRKPESDATFKKLTPKLKMAIREELNNYKKSEMTVHVESTHNTCFH